MRPKSIFLLLLALACGLVAAIGVSQVLDKKAEGEGPSLVETEAIYVALADINLGDGITADLIKLEDWPTDKVPPDAMRELEGIEGRRPRTKIYAGEPIREAKLVAPNSIDGAADQIPPGYRVIPVRVDAASGGAGLVRPGDRVDVQLFVKKNIKTDIHETKTQTILQNVRVFAVDQEFRRASEEENGGDVAHTISLVVRPVEADKVALATRLGDLRLIMRNPTDSSEANPHGVSVDTLFGKVEKGDRDSERGVDGSSDSPSGSGGKGLLGFLGSMVRGSQTSGGTTTQPTLPGTTGSLPFVAASPTWTMVIHEGSESREVQFGAPAPAPQTPAVGPFTPLDNNGGEEEAPQGEKAPEGEVAPEGVE